MHPHWKAIDLLPEVFPPPKPHAVPDPKAVAQKEAHAGMLKRHHLQQRQMLGKGYEWDEQRRVWTR